MTYIFTFLLMLGQRLIKNVGRIFQKFLSRNCTDFVDSLVVLFIIKVIVDLSESLINNQVQKLSSGR